MVRKYGNLIALSAFLLLGILLVSVIIPKTIMSKSTTAIGAEFFPYLISIFIIIFSLITIIYEFIRLKKEDNDSGEEKEEYSFVRVIMAFICLHVWIIVIPVLGFIWTNIIIITLIMFIMDNRKWYQLILVSTLFTGITYIIFIQIFKVSF